MLTQYISADLIKEALECYQWPAPYQIEDELPEGINVAFPQSNFYFVEGMYGDVSVEFLPDDTGDEQMRFTIQDALEVLTDVDTRGYDFFHISGAHSEEKVVRDIERCIALIHEHLLSVVEGDFSWVDEARSRRLSL